MASQLFTQINDKAERAGVQRRTAKSREWFIKNLKNIRNMSRRSLLLDDSLVLKQKPLIGRMFMFFYDPKGKETLPVYDRFPLIIMVGPAKKGFYGLNLHYLSPRMRAVFFDRLLEHTNNDKYDETTKFRLTYNMLQGAGKLRAFQPCFKHYLYNHVASKTVEVPAEQWETALFLPTDSFVNLDRNQVWNSSRKSIR